jgi:uncharacterized SAM-binding protein YcdF (DUF218 family)
VSTRPASIAIHPPRARPRQEPPSRLRRALLVIASLFALAGLVYLVHVPVLVEMAHFLDVSVPPERSDVLFLHMGQIESRPIHAAELYRRGVAPRVVLARPTDDLAVKMGIMPDEADASARLMEALGVPASAITIVDYPGGTTSTTDEARALREYLARHPARRITAVTSRYHTRRARWNLRRQLSGLPVEIRMDGTDDPTFDETNWWKDEHGLVYCFEEYLKFVQNWLYR